MKTDIEIARASQIMPIMEIGAKLGIAYKYLIPYGHNKAKIDCDFIATLKDKPNGKLILVTAISPTPAGEGKTTTTVGLGDALNSIGKQTAICLREPSLGPCFGSKGGATGGGFAQVVPMEDINLHFTGDFHAIGAAHNLLSALIDNHIKWDNESKLDPQKITWRRVMDMNDRTLRDIVIGLGGTGNGIPRQTGFDITVSSEIMAIFCLATDINDLQRRIGNIIVGYSVDKKSVSARDLMADGAMMVLLKDAFSPNLVQTLEHNPAFIHGGPFANIAHGCNSVVATQTALKVADYVVTEAGFGADLGAEKFFNIKCRKAGLEPDAVVLVATVRALKMHGGVSIDALNAENTIAVKKGLDNLGRHLRNLQQFGVPIVVGINHFITDRETEIRAIIEYCNDLGVEVCVCKHWAEGSKGAQELAHKVVALVESGTAKFSTLYPDNMPLLDKIRHIARTLYGARDIFANDAVRNTLASWEQEYGHFPVCIAKTQYSFSTEPNVLGAPSNHIISIREVRLAAGAEFIVVICGSVMTMPGLPRFPAANYINLNDEGLIEGLF
ncbi:formate--tetrahydrofolate ligase [Paraglaciecola psychrophila]|uniref:Formate--tetrahydrofolate ligase n=1 Tax=Paraglaciecola psychrophila 170 TaxID=1129794 RepID=K7AKM2_9ALTE|nr:formate--tetrahydrofolate ligase [Paraglaciecola psychrophila]AGH46875.1 formate--tetrahydrofolate ligase [Paraglaciecola psychrophila 170]GAC36005.1 formate--tetrahydrofolate ligase [Paraglaciecola psychrophila 170]